MTRGHDEGVRSGSLAVYAPLADELPWRADAACDGTPVDRWFLDAGTDATTALAWCRAVCSACSVRAECLTYALQRPQLVGVWAGTTERQRARLRQQCKAAEGVHPQLPGAVQCSPHQEVVND